MIGVVANLGLNPSTCSLFGPELDVGELKGWCSPKAAAISNASVALPMALGIAVAVPIYGLVAPDREFLAFALFMGVAMSITAFPVLARILVERRMLQRPVGALTMAAAAIDDVTAWFLIAAAIAVRGRRLGDRRRSHDAACRRLLSTDVLRGQAADRAGLRCLRGSRPGAG